MKGEWKTLKVSILGDQKGAGIPHLVMAAVLSSDVF